MFKTTQFGSIFYFDIIARLRVQIMVMFVMRHLFM